MGAPKRRQFTAKQKRAYEGVLAYLSETGLAPGDQIESYPAVAKRLGVSLALVQRVMKMLVDDGVLEAVPRVGTFVARLPEGDRAGPASGPFSALRVERAPRPGQTTIRLYAAEMGEPSRRYWRAVVDAFEKEHPDIRVNFSMRAHDMGPIAGADVSVIETGGALAETDESLAWVDLDVDDPATLLAPLADQVSHRPERTYWPIMLSGTVTYANKRLLEAAGLYHPERFDTARGIAQTCDEYFARDDIPEGVLGWGYHNLSMPLQLLGYPMRSLEPVREEVVRYVDLLGTCPPPRLVTGEDVNSTSYLVDGLVEQTILIVTGYFWHNLYAESDAWEALMPPLAENGTPLGGSMSVSIRRGTSHPEEAVTLARFLAGPTAQRIIGAAGGLLPTLESVAREHVFYDFYSKQFAGGWIREEFDSELFKTTEAYRTLECLYDVRSGRMDRRDAVERIMAFKAGTGLTIVRPGRRGARSGSRKRRAKSAR